MKNKNIITVIFLTAVLAAIPLMATIKAARAQEAAVQDNSAVLNKLDQVLEGQKAIMAQMDAIKQELNIVKIRITQQQ